MTEQSGGGGAAEPWYGGLGLDDAGKQFVAGKGFTSPAELIRSHMEADRLVRDRNVLPAPDADPAKRADWAGWKSLGWEPDRGKYSVEPVKVPDGRNYDSAMEKAFLDAAHEARIPASAAKMVLDKVAEFGFSAQQQHEARSASELQQADQALRARWGRDYDTNRERARSAAQYLGVGAEDVSELEKIVGAPRVADLFAKIGGMLGEDTLKGGSPGGGARGGGGMTPEGAAAERARLAADTEFMRSMRDPRHPQHTQSNARWNQLIDLENK